MMIFSRWGEFIMVLDGLGDSWDGMIPGDMTIDMQQDGVYVWVIKCTDVTGKEHKLTGHVNLLR
jgi:hypothetical protein